ALHDPPHWVGGLPRAVAVMVVRNHPANPGHLHGIWAVFGMPNHCREDRREIGQTLPRIIQARAHLAHEPQLALTAWLTLRQRGTRRMTQPTIVYFGYEKAAHRGCLGEASR